MGGSTARSRVVCVLVSAGVTAAVCWAVWPELIEDTVRVVDASEGLEAAFARRDALPAGADRSDWVLPRLPIDEELAAVFCPALNLNQEYHPSMLARRKRNLSIRRPFPEHPSGKWTITTNSLGMREEAEPARVPPDLRVLVVGDSHVDGVCHNDESYPNVLEEMIRGRYPRRSVEVLNAAAGGWSFYNYLGALEAYLELEPDLFIVTVYGGNDFGAMPIHHYHRGEPLRVTQRDLKERLKVVGERGRGRAQFYNQAAYFASNPDEEEAAAEMAGDVTREIARIAGENAIAVICVYLPPARDVQAARYPELAAADEIMELDEDALGVCDRLADSWLAQSADLGLPAVDLRPTFRAATRDLYWHFDQHVNVTGNRLIAATLLPEVERLAGLAR